MSSLVSCFATRMHKRVASAHGETTPSFEVPRENRPKLSGPNEEALKSLTVINVDSSNRAFDATKIWRVTPGCL